MSSEDRPMRGGSEGKEAENRSVSGPAGTGHRNLYLLILGILAGALGGPGMLGRWAPQVYERWFLGTSSALAQLQDYDRNAEELLERLRATGVTEVAISEKRREIIQGRWPLVVEAERARQEQRNVYLGRMTAIILAIVLMMVVESLLNPAEGNRVGRLHDGLTTARFALAGVWLAMLLARPDVLEGVSGVFLALLVIVGLATAAVPIGRSLKSGRG